MYPIILHEGRRWRLGEDTGIENFNHYNVSINVYPKSTPTISQNSAPSNNQSVLLAHKDMNYDDTVVISNKAQKTPNIDNDSIATEYAISDYGATGYFLVEGAPVKNLQVADNPISITIPNGKNMTSMHTYNLDIPWLPNHVTEAHIVPRLAHALLVYRRKFCEAVCKVIFDKN